jgi:hypothetical protein
LPCFLKGGPSWERSGEKGLIIPWLSLSVIQGLILIILSTYQDW